MTYLPSRLLLALGAAVALSASAAAQCLDWRPFPLVLPEIPRALDVCVHDDGTGAVLAFSIPAGADPVRSWDGAQFATVGAGLAGAVTDLVSFDDGSGPALYASGELTVAGLTGTVSFVRWNGIAWDLVGGAAPAGSVHDIEIHDDGGGPALYVAGRFLTVGAVAAGCVAKWDGLAWSVVGPIAGLNENRTVNRLASHHDGVAPALCAWAENFWSVSHGFAQWRNGTWSTIAPGPTDTISDLRSFDDGTGPALWATVLLGGVSRWNGTNWQSLLGLPRSASLSVADTGGGPRLYAGPWTPNGGAYRWEGNGWTHLAPNGGTGCSLLVVDRLCAFDDGSGPALYAASGVGATGVAGNGLTRWDGTEWVGVGAQRRGIDGIVRAFTVYDSGDGPELHVGGNFCGADDTAKSSGVVRWDGSEWKSLGGPYIGDISALESVAVGTGTKLYAARLDAWVLEWSEPQARWLVRVSYSNQDPASRIFALQSFQGSLYIGGVFAAPPWPSRNIARLNGLTVQAVGTGLLGGGSGQVNAMTVFDDGTGEALYVGGRFTSAGPVALQNVGRWNGTQWTALGGGIDGLVVALAVFDDGTGPALYAGGDFTTAGGVPAINIARWSGSSWSALGSGLAGQVLTLTVFDDGSGPALHAGGNFDSVGGAPSPVARWNGSSWTRLGDGPDGVVWTMIGHDDGSGVGEQLYVGGDFEHIGALPSRSFAAWRGCGGVLARFCFGDGSTVDCPCGNRGVPSRGCENSALTGGARLNATGTTQPDTIELYVASELQNAATLVFQGDALLANPVAFGDGLRCAGGHLVRLYTTNAVNGSLAVPGPGQPSVSARSAAQGDPLAPGDVRAYQSWYRDSNPTFCASPAGGAWNLSNAVRIVW